MLMILRKKSIIREVRREAAYVARCTAEPSAALLHKNPTVADLTLIMKGIFVALLGLSGCAWGVEPPACSGQRSCDSARAALVNAEASVEDALRHKALWTTAQSALLEARAAFARGDYDAAARAAGSADELAQMGIAQTRYSPFPAPKP